MLKFSSIHTLATEQKSHFALAFWVLHGLPQPIFLFHLLSFHRLRLLCHVSRASGYRLWQSHRQTRDRRGSLLTGQPRKFSQTKASGTGSYLFNFKMWAQRKRLNGKELDMAQLPRRLTPIKPQIASYILIWSLLITDCIKITQCHIRWFTGLLSHKQLQSRTSECLCWYSSLQCPVHPTLLCLSSQRDFIIRCSLYFHRGLSQVRW